LLTAIKNEGKQGKHKISVESLRPTAYTYFRTLHFPPPFLLFLYFARIHSFYNFFSLFFLFRFYLDTSVEEVKRGWKKNTKLKAEFLVFSHGEKGWFSK
jgi:hypothetical protein